MDRLVLWDVDGTLITAAGVSQEAYAAAFTAVTQRDLEVMPNLAGKTDHDLVTSTLAAHGIPASDEIINAFYTALGQEMQARRSDVRAQGSAMIGAAQALDALARVPGVVQSVVTGNIRPVAYEKLAVFDLAGPIDFDVGGYGSDDGARSTLVRLARERAARKYGATLPAHRVVVVGDTPYDIAGARANGALAIGVATGRSTSDQLTAAGADVVLASLADTAAVVRAVLHPNPGRR